MMTTWSSRNHAFFPFPHELSRVVGRVGAESAGVGGRSHKKDPPTPDPSPPHRFATRGEGKR
jgi:hypothetical protein